MTQIKSCEICSGHYHIARTHCPYCGAIDILGGWISDVGQQYAIELVRAKGISQFVTNQPKLFNNAKLVDERG